MDDRSDLKSFVWKYDAPGRPEGKRFHKVGKNDAWKCAFCAAQKHPIDKYYLKTGGTRTIAEYLRLKHKGELAKEELSNSEEEQKDLQNILEMLRGAKPKEFIDGVSKLEDIREDVVQSLLAKFIVDCQLPFSLVEKDSFRHLIQYINPVAIRCVPKSHNTMKTYIMARYNNEKKELINALSKASSKVHISVDAWTSPNGHAFIGIVSRWTTNRRHQNVLALRNITGSHTGENMSLTVHTVLKEYEIQGNFGFINADNASNNNTMVSAMEQVLGNDNIQWHGTTNRIRCLGHILNLSLQAFLWQKEHHPDERIDKELPSIEDVQAWTKHGPLGKLHNLIVWTYASPQRIQSFLRVSKGLGLTRDNNTRWTSWYDTLERALRLKQEIQQWEINVRTWPVAAGQKRPLQLDDEDWELYECYESFLKPYRHAILATEGSRDNLSRILQAMDFLLEDLETAKRDPKYNNTLIKKDIDLAWKLLNKYYLLTDETPIYGAAVVMDPRQKWDYFTQYWTGEMSKFIPTMKVAVCTASLIDLC
jgi:hypothetical protein